MSVNDAENFDDVERDKAYFKLFFELESKNLALYEELARNLIKQKSLVIQIDNFWNYQEHRLHKILSLMLWCH